jgi:hypothetical protein
MNSSPARIYQVQVAGHLDDQWSASFDNITVTRHDDGTSTLTGPVADQAQLHGILARLRDIGATLLSLHPLETAASESQGAHTQAGIRVDGGRT